MGPEVEKGGYVCYSKSESEKSRDTRRGVPVTDQKGCCVVNEVGGMVGKGGRKEWVKN